MAWVWQFAADGEPDAIASTLADKSMGVLLKTHGGTDWMSRYDTSVNQVSGPTRVAKLAGYFEDANLRFHVWFVPNGVDPIREAEMCAEVISAGARSITVDLEPFEGFWQGSPETALVFGREFRRLQPMGIMFVCVDPRPWILKVTPVAEFASFSQGFAPMTYWDTFRAGENGDYYRDSGFPPGPGGITPRKEDTR